MVRRSAARPFVGWRYWQLAAGTGWLRSVTQRRVVWPPGRPLRATCAGSGHRAPTEWCRCGIYAAAERAALLDHGLCLAPEPLIIGRVALWGTVVADADGHRGEVAHPEELAVVTETVTDEPTAALAERLAATYEVPVGTLGLAEAVGDVSAAIMAFQALSATTRPMASGEVGSESSDRHGARPVDARPVDEL